ncbi:hypothetical protein ACVBEF_11560 [Glaciimonas sp. GG7]
MPDAIANYSAVHVHPSERSVPPGRNVRNNFRYAANTDLQILNTVKTIAGVIQNIHIPGGVSKPGNTLTGSHPEYDSSKSKHPSKAFQNLKAVGKNKQPHGRKNFYQAVRHSQKLSSRKLDTSGKSTISHNIKNSTLPLPPGFNATHMLSARASSVSDKTKNPGNHTRQSHPLSHARVSAPIKNSSLVVSEKSNRRSPQTQNSKSSWQYLPDYEEEVVWSWEWSAPTSHVRIVPSIAEMALAGQDHDPVPSQPAPSAPPPPSDIDFPQFTRLTDDQDWNELEVDYKNNITLTDILMQSQNISFEDAAVRYKLIAEDIQKSFTAPGKPERHWQALSDEAHRLFAAKYALQMHAKNATRSEAFVMGNTCFKHPANPEENFKRAYADALQINLFSLDTALMESTRVSASDALRTLLVQEGLPSQKVHFDDYMHSLIFEKSTDSSQSFPLAFNRAAILHKYRNSTNPEQAFLNDSQTSIHAVRKEYKQKIGFEQVNLHMIDDVLRVLGYDGMTFSSPSTIGLHFEQLVDLPALRKIPFFSSLDKAQQIVFLNYVRMQTGESGRYRLRSLEHSVDTMLIRSLRVEPHVVAYPAGDDAWFNLGVGLHFAASNGVRKVGAGWDTPFLKEIATACSKMPSLRFWLMKNLQTLKRDPINLNFVISLANRLREISEATPDAIPVKLAAYAKETVTRNTAEVRNKTSDDIAPWPGDAEVQKISRTAWKELVFYARKIVARYNISEGVYGGNSEDIATFLKEYVQQDLGEYQVQPTSRQAWKDWLASRQSGGNTLAYELAHDGSDFNASKKYSNQNLIYMIEKVGWPGSADLLQELKKEQKSLAGASCLRLGPERDIHPAYDPLVLLARTGHEVQMRVDAQGNACDLAVRLIADDNRVTTVDRSPNGKLLDNNWCGATQYRFGQMFAENIHDHSLYSGWPASSNLHPSDMKIGDKLFSKNPTTTNLTQFLGKLNNFSGDNPGAMFDKIFTIDKKFAHVDSDPRADFIDMCRSWTFKGIFHAGSPGLGKWAIVYNNDFYAEYGTDRISIMENNQFEKMPFLYALNGDKERFPIQRGFLHELLHPLSLQNDPRGQDLRYQGFIIALTNLIVQQAGLGTSYRYTYSMTKVLPSLDERLDQFREAQLSDQYLEAIIAQIAPPEVQGAVFSTGASDSLTVTKVRECFAKLDHHKLPDSSPLLNAFTVEGDPGGEFNNQLQLDHLNAIFHALYSEGNLFAQLAIEHQHRLLDKPWRFHYLDPTAAAKTFDLYGASHLVDHAARTVYARYLPQSYITFLGPNGLMPLTTRRQATLIGLEILTATPNLRGEQACVDRGLVAALADICLQKYEPVPQVAAATIDSMEEVPSLQLLSKLTHTRRRKFDEDWYIKQVREEAEKSGVRRLPGKGFFG